MDPEIPIDLGIQKVLQDLDIHFCMLMKLKNWEMMLYTTNKTGEKN